MKKHLLTLLMAGFALSGFAQVTPPTGAVEPQASTADAPQWYAMMSSHLTATDRQNRYLYYDGSRLATEQHSDGLDTQAEDITKFAWRLEEYTDVYGFSGVRLIHYDGSEVQVPATAEAIANTQLTMVASGEGSTWELMTSASTGQSQCAELQYVLDWTGKTMNQHAYLNAMDGSVTGNAYGITIYNAGAHQASGWFFVPLQLGDEGGDTGQWAEVYSNKMSGASAADIDGTDVKVSYDNPDWMGVFHNTDGATGAILDGEQYCYAIYGPFQGDFIAVVLDIDEAGTYKFDFRARLSDTSGSNASVSAYLAHSSTGDAGLTPVSSDLELTPSTAIPAQQLTSDELDLEPGEHMFAVRLSAYQSTDASLFFVGDFHLYKMGGTQPAETYSVTWQQPEGGTITVSDGDNELSSGAQVESGTALTATFTADEGYVLSSVTLNGEDVTSSVSDGSLAFTVSESDVTLAATFTEESAPSLWKTVYSNTLSGTTEDEVDYTGWGSDGTYGIYQATASGAVLDGYQYCTGLSWPWSNEYIYLIYDIEEAGTYKFSIRARMEGQGSANNVTLRYGNANSIDYGTMTVVSDSYTFSESFTLPGELMESREFDLQPGSYKFCVYIGETNSTNNATRLFIGDFNLYKRNDGVTECTVTWATPEHGTLTVMAGDTQLRSGDGIAAGTAITVTATADEGYQLETLTVGGEPFTSGESYVVEANTEIVATFTEIPPTMYTVSWSGDNCDITVKTSDGTPVGNGSEVAEGTVLTITAEAADGYELESLTVNGEDFESGTTWTVAGDVAIVAKVRGTGIDATAADGIYYDAASATLHVGGTCALSIYDVTGRKVVDTEAESTFDASGLRDGIYIAVVDGKVVKFRK